MPILYTLNPKTSFYYHTKLADHWMCTLEQLSFCKTEKKSGWHQFYLGKQRGEGVSDCIVPFFQCALNNYSSWYSPFATLLFTFGYPSLVFYMVGCPGIEDLHVFVVRNTKLVLHKTSWEMVFILHNIWSLLGQVWASPTLAGLHCKHACVFLFVCLWPYTITLKRILWSFGHRMP